jgi:hypothetical protein
MKLTIKEFLNALDVALENYHANKHLNQPIKTSEVESHMEDLVLFSEAQKQKDQDFIDTSHFEGYAIGYDPIRYFEEDGCLFSEVISTSRFYGGNIIREEETSNPFPKVTYASISATRFNVTLSIWETDLMAYIRYQSNYIEEFLFVKGYDQALSFEEWRAYRYSHFRNKINLSQYLGVHL